MLSSSWYLKLRGWLFSGEFFFSRFVHFHVQLSIVVIVAAGIGSCRYRAAIITIGIIIVVVADGWLISFFYSTQMPPPTTLRHIPQSNKRNRFNENAIESFIAHRRLFAETMEHAKVLKALQPTHSFTHAQHNESRPLVYREKKPNCID